MEYFAEETRRARLNFPLDHRRVDLRLVYAIVEVKKAAARTYAELGVDPDLYDAVASACDRVLAGQADDQFVTQALQGGARVIDAALQYGYDSPNLPHIGS